SRRDIRLRERRLRGTDLTWPQVELSKFGSSLEVHQADGVIAIVSCQQPRPVLGHREPRNHWSIRAQTDTVGVSQTDLGCLAPRCAGETKNQHCVIRTTGDVKL